MSYAGFVLVGGKSSRMGRDKAFLPWNGSTLLEQVAATVAGAAGSVALIGDPERYSCFGHPVYPDLWPACGPIGGIATALAVSPAEWCLVTGCDMPRLSFGALRQLLDEIPPSGGPRCVLPVGPTGPEPLCGVYHRDCLPLLEKAIDAGRLRMRDAVTDLVPLLVAQMDPGCFVNLNTPEDFEAFAHT